MFYVNQSVPDSYHYLVEVSDNYFILTNTPYSDGAFDSPDRVKLLYCYLTPSFTTIESSRNYTYSTTFTDVSDQITNNLYYAPDFPLILFVSLFLCVLICLLYNGLTRLIRPHGIMF